MDLRPDFHSCVEVRRTIVDLSDFHHILQGFILYICFAIQDAFPVETKGYFNIVLGVVIDVEKDIFAVIGVFKEFLFEIVDGDIELFFKCVPVVFY